MSIIDYRIWQTLSSRYTDIPLQNVPEGSSFTEEDLQRDRMLTAAALELVCFLSSKGASNCLSRDCQKYHALWFNPKEHHLFLAMGRARPDVSSLEHGDTLCRDLLEMVKSGFQRGADPECLRYAQKAGNAFGGKITIIRAFGFNDNIPELPGCKELLELNEPADPFFELRDLPRDVLYEKLVQQERNRSRYAVQRF